MATMTTVSLQATRHYSRLSLYGHLYKTDTSVKLRPTLGTGPKGVRLRDGSLYIKYEILNLICDTM